MDDGPGVSEAEIARLMEPRFRSAQARTRRPDGQGLGLAIAAEAINRLDMTLTLGRNDPAGLRAEIRSRASRPTVSRSSPVV
jgi:signal transduction histidine kinase